MFDFSLVSKRKRKNAAILTTTAKSPEKEQSRPQILPEEHIKQHKVEIKEDNSNSLKILFEDDAYKCPIEGCGKMFRRKNLAQMHEHYHPEYTKFLDSTPNVADLAYARTVRENLDRSPGEQQFEDYYSQQSNILKRVHAENNESIKGRESDQPKTLTTPLISTPILPLPHNLPPSPHLQLSSSAVTLKQPETQPSFPTKSSNNIIEGGEVIKTVRMKQDEIINCTCGFMEEDGLMIQRELCLCWQHAYCNNIERENQVPEKYVCYICQNPLRERQSRKYYHNQDMLTKGVLLVGSYHNRAEAILHKRFDKLKKCHDLSGGLIELGHYQHNLKNKMKIAELIMSNLLFTETGLSSIEDILKIHVRFKSWTNQPKRDVYAIWDCIHMNWL